MSLLKPLAASARLRCSCLAPIARPVTRSIHATPTTLKKSRKSAQAAEEFENEPEVEEDLFDLSPSTPTIRDASEQLQPLLNQLESIRSLPSDERTSAFSDVRVGVLRRIVQLYPVEEVDGLKGVLRSWRMLGGRVTRKTAEEIVGRLVRLERADLAVELANDRTQYGLPALPTHIQSRLLHALLQSPSPQPLAAAPTIPSSKTLATLRLAMRHKLAQEPLTREELGKLVGEIKRVKVEARDADEWRGKARGMLESAGGLWADAARRIEAA